MPSHAFWPGETCWLELQIENQGVSYPEADLFVALDLGFGEYWLWPSWCHYPNELDWEDTSFPDGTDETRSIISEFFWPGEVEVLNGAQFLALALSSEGELVSNLSIWSLHWGEAPLTPTPTSIPTGSPTPTPGTSDTATPTPFFSPLPAIFLPAVAGSFDMGSPHDEMCRFDDDELLHQVLLNHDFLVQQTEVTQEQWVSFFGVNPSHHIGCAQCPVENVTWYDCIIYCNRASQFEDLRPAYYTDSSFSMPFDGIPPVTTGLVYWDRTAPGYRLPTESEWEYACRAGTTTPYNSGEANSNCYDDPLLDPLAWYYYSSDTGRGRESQPVGTKQGNGWFLYDLHGNVEEWCWDWYAAYPAGSVTDPTGPDTGFHRVRRGGSWFNQARYNRSAYRTDAPPFYRCPILGFRPVRNDTTSRED